MSLAPITGFAIEYGAVALATYAATRAIPQLPRSQPTADALDEVGKGLSLRRGREQLNAISHWRQNVKLKKLVEVLRLTPRLSLELYFGK
jgi:hypothetical protein|tara:strand:+ start:709 stop:978 length:270 start_codon:yes stop_codon:yes gene_type:complete